MKSIRTGLLLVLMLVVAGPLRAFGQSAEAQQLMLNTEKLAQLKGILSSMKEGYEILAKGYGSVKDIAQGNFSLHKGFLDSLLVGSPAVKNYRKVADIISYQRSVVSEYKAALAAFGSADVFNAAELEYLGKVYEGLFKASLQNLEDLAMVVTSSKLRMNDEERFKAIDRIFLDTEDKLVFLRSFNQRAVLLFHQKKKEKREIESLRVYYGLGSN